MSEKGQRLVVPCVLIVFSIVYFSLSLQIPQNDAMAFGADYMPKLTGGALFLVSCVILVKEIIAQRPSTVKSGERSDSSESESGERPNYLKVILTLGLIAGYVALWEYVGFLLMTVLYLFVQFIVLSRKSERSYVRFAIVSVVASLAVYLIFVKLLHLMIPNGIFG